MFFKKLKKHSYVSLSILLIIIKTLFLLPVTISYGGLIDFSSPIISPDSYAHVNIFYFLFYLNSFDGDIGRIDYKQHLLECLVIILIVFILYIILKYIKSKKAV